MGGGGRTFRVAQLGQEAVFLATEKVVGLNSSHTVVGIHTYVQSRSPPVRPSLQTVS